MNLKTFKNFLFCLSFLGILIVNGNVLATPDLPDLVVTNIFNNCSYNTIGVTVCNQGSNTNNMFRIAIKSNNHSMASGFVSISINNPCITYSFFSSSLGININDSYTATATADPLTGGIDMVKESDENNNTLTKIVQGCSSALSSVNGQCGSANGQSFNSAPTTNLCAQGTESQIINNSEYNLWLWICNGSNDGGRVGCYAYKKINAQCGDANGYSFESMPTSKLCLSGTAGPIIDSGFSSWLWICYGPNFGINVGCYAYKKEPIRKFNNLSKF